LQPLFQFAQDIYEEREGSASGSVLVTYRSGCESRRPKKAKTYGIYGFRSGCGYRRPKNIRILWIRIRMRIRNTTFNHDQIVYAGELDEGELDGAELAVDAQDFFTEAELGIGRTARSA
jgi:hypothetical protein